MRSNDLAVNDRCNASTPYTDAFYLAQRDASSRSADCVVPLVLSLVPAKSVIDIGCGVGTWAAKFLECGVDEVLGVDGAYVNRELLKIPPDCFAARDLTKPLRIERRFDLAVCLEVAEHLPPGRAESLVDDLVRLAPVVLFSAAIPGQGGTDHINERFLSYWSDLFSARDHVLLDVIRPAIWNEERCDWPYRQNAVLFAQKGARVSAATAPSGVDYVHPYLYDTVREKLDRPTLGYLISSLPGSLRRSLRTRWKRLLAR
jgi:SAM-dependent methyltransferase